MWFLPEVPIGDVAGVPLWTLSPKDWEAAGRGWVAAPEGPGRGPGGVSLCGDVSGVLRGVLGCDVCPPARRASRLLRILSEYAHIYTLIEVIVEPECIALLMMLNYEQSQWSDVENTQLGFYFKNKIYG